MKISRLRRRVAIFPLICCECCEPIWEGRPYAVRPDGNNQCLECMEAAMRTPQFVTVAMTMDEETE
jgi:hypothetical protein